MAIKDYELYKISLNSDSKKQQSLQVGDVVRRQYWDGNNLIYSLMVVVESSCEVENSYFVGLLLDGGAPSNGELLDFVRMTNLFDEDRLGALYLTASDDKAPYMDIIDNIGKSSSLCWPEGISTSVVADNNQYMFDGSSLLSLSYDDTDQSRNRVCKITKKVDDTKTTCQLKQSFNTLIDAAEFVLVSYWIKGSEEQTLDVKFGYSTGSKVDSKQTVSITKDWAYKVQLVQVANSGRHERSFTLDLKALAKDTTIYISDFNIIRVNSLLGFANSSQMRIGKLDGVTDPVFGELKGYGAHFNQMYATQGAHVSGTLTAGDENGFGATFYAGKIHRNAFLNSLDYEVVAAKTSNNEVPENPTGVGKQLAVTVYATVKAQEAEWLAERVGETYTLSFWLYAKKACTLTVTQNNNTVGSFAISWGNTFAWKRYSCTFKLQAAADTDLQFSIVPNYETASSSESGIYTAEIAIAAPQLESGEYVTQYQPTDATVVPSDDYGAWFSKGGIGGTMQNPLLQLNSDGSIASRGDTFRIEPTGEGHVAKGNISWDEDGKVKFGSNVTLNWDNFNQDTQHQIENKHISLSGADTFAVMGSSEAGILYSPDYITLKLTETNIYATAATRKWYYEKDGKYIEIEDTPNFNSGHTQLTIYPDNDMWSDMASTLTIKVVVTYQSQEYTDTATIRKYQMDGYTVKITSSGGTTFKNGTCSTVLTAQVLYHGEPVDDDFVAEHFTYQWRKYLIPDTENEVENWWVTTIYNDNGIPMGTTIDRFSKTLTLNGKISGSEAYVCEISTIDGASFPYFFPILF
jgi:hypothetical protein